MVEINKLCKHPRLLTRWWVTQGRARMQCKDCGFSVEVTGENLNEQVLKAEFNLAVQKASIGQHRFSVS